MKVRQVKLDQDVVHRGHQFGPFLDQAVRTGAVQHPQRPGHGIDFAPLLSGLPRGDM